ncbi:hypothetical protein ABFA07_017549 [Porites harrisoni]
MTRFQELLLNVSLFLSMVTLIRARITVNKCQDSSPKASCRQQCGQADPQLKSCEQTCLDHGPCDLRCVTKGSCHQDCESLPTCGSVFCKTANCTQLCDEGMCNMSCRATSDCKQLCNAGSCHLKCAKTSERCKQSCKEGSCPTFCSAKRSCDQNCDDGECPMRCTTDDCIQSCTGGKCRMKCRTKNSCEQQCSFCPLVECHSKEKSCRQDGAEKMLIRAKVHGNQNCKSGGCHQNCTSEFRCYQSCKGGCPQHCTTGERCEQSCSIDGRCHQSCTSNSCEQRCDKGGNCNMTCKARDRCVQQCSKGGCHGVCDSLSCLQHCDAGNCTMECNGMQCQHNCTGGGCNLTCPDGALCKLHCGAHQNCTITRKVKPRKSGHLTGTVSRTSDEHGNHLNKRTTNNGCSFDPCRTLFMVVTTVMFLSS